MFGRQRHRRLGNHALSTPSYDVSLNKEEVARRALDGRSGRFLEIGAGDKELRYLLGVRENLDVDEAFYLANRKWFAERFEYLPTDLSGAGGALPLDICADKMTPPFDEMRVDVVYSNNVFEHLRKPWKAAENILKILRPGGICITIAPFACRYHAVPGDYFRFTHTGLTSLFEDAGNVRVLTSGYDIKGRRNNWQGGGQHDDIVPIDELGAWRETWFAVSVIEKLPP